MKDYYKKLYFGQIENNHILVEEINRLENNNKVLKDTIDNAIDFCERYHSLNLEDFDTYKLLEKLLEILGGDNNGM